MDDADAERHPRVPQTSSRHRPGTRPDGIPYTGWRNAGSRAHTVLVRVRAHMTATQRAFPPKGVEATDLPNSGQRARRPENTRPLALKNTDCKTAAATINFPIRNAMKDWTVEQHRGFVATRGPLQHIVCLETYARSLTMAAMDCEWDDDDDDDEHDGDNSDGDNDAPTHRRTAATLQQRRRARNDAAHSRQRNEPRHDADATTASARGPRPPTLDAATRTPLPQTRRRRPRQGATPMDAPHTTTHRQRRGAPDETTRATAHRRSDNSGGRGRPGGPAERQTRHL